MISRCFDYYIKKMKDEDDFIRFILGVTYFSSFKNMQIKNNKAVFSSLFDEGIWCMNVSFHKVSQYSSSIKYSCMRNQVCNFNVNSASRIQNSSVELFTI